MSKYIDHTRVVYWDDLEGNLTVPGNLLSKGSTIVSNEQSMSTLTVTESLIAPNDVFAPSLYGSVNYIGLQSTIATSVFNPILVAGVKDWRDIQMSANGQYITAVSYGAEIAVSNNYGESWNTYGIPATYVKVAVSYTGQYQLAAAGDVYLSTDFGRTWTAKGIIGAITCVAISASGGYMSATMQNGKIYTSSNFGSIWYERDSDRNWASIAISASGQYQVASALSGRVYVSSDFGVSWASKTATSNWSDVTVSGNGETMAAIQQGVALYISSDYGDTWAIRDGVISYNAVTISANGQFLISAGIAGDPLRISTDYGNTWTSSTTTYSNTITNLAISVPGRYIAFAVPNEFLYILALPAILRTGLSTSDITTGGLIVYDKLQASTIVVGKGVASDKNELTFAGVSGDAPAATLIAERLYSSNDYSEMLIYKGHDVKENAGPDRIRLKAAAIELQTFSQAETDPYAERQTGLYINPKSLIGIGTSTPNAKLDIINTSVKDSLQIANSIDNLSSLLRITSNGNVAIGTSTSREISHALEVFGTTELMAATYANNIYASSIGVSTIAGQYTPSTISATSSIVIGATNFAQSWSSNASADIAGVTDIQASYSGQFQYAAVSGDVYKSTDFGINWGQSAFIGGLLTGIDTDAAGRFVTVARSNNLYYSEDYAETFAPATVGTVNATIRDVAISSNGKFQYASGSNTSNGYLLKSTDFGVTWSGGTTPLAGYGYSKITTSYDGAVIGVTTPNGVFISRDFGSNIAQYLTGSAISDIATNSNGKFISVLSPSFIMRTSDFGSNWAAAYAINGGYSISMSASGQYQLALINNVFDNITIYSTDYGSNWSVTSPTSQFLALLSGDSLRATLHGIVGTEYITYTGTPIMSTIGIVSTMYYSKPLRVESELTVLQNATFTNIYTNNTQTSTLAVSTITGIAGGSINLNAPINTVTTTAVSTTTSTLYVSSIKGIDGPVKFGDNVIIPLTATIDEGQISTVLISSIVAAGTDSLNIGSVVQFNDDIVLTGAAANVAFQNPVGVSQANIGVNAGDLTVEASRVFLATDANTRLAVNADTIVAQTANAPISLIRTDGTNAPKTQLELIYDGEIRIGSTTMTTIPRLTFVGDLVSTSIALNSTGSALVASDTFIAPLMQTSSIKLYDGAFNASFFVSTGKSTIHATAPIHTKQIVASTITNTENLFVGGETYLSNSLHFATANKTIDAPNGTLTIQVADAGHRITLDSITSTTTITELGGDINVSAGDVLTLSAGSNIVVNAAGVQLAEFVAADSTIRFGSNEESRINSIGALGIFTYASTLSNALTIDGTTLMLNTLTGKNMFGDNVTFSTIITHGNVIINGITTMNDDMTGKSIAADSIKLSTLQVDELSYLSSVNLSGSIVGKGIYADAAEISTVAFISAAVSSLNVATETVSSIIINAALASTLNVSTIHTDTVTTFTGSTVFRDAAVFSNSTRVSTLIVGLGVSDNMNEIQFAGVTGDGVAHSVLAERIYDVGEKSELLISKLSEVATDGPDRIRLKAPVIDFQTFASNETDPYAERTSAMFIDCNGSIGMGTYAPAAKLHIIQTSDADAFRVDDVAGDTSVFRVDSNGAVGIATGATALSNALTVAGTTALHDTLFGSTILADAGTFSTLNIIGTVQIGSTIVAEDIYADDLTVSTLTVSSITKLGDSVTFTTANKAITAPTGSFTIQVVDSNHQIDINSATSNITVREQLGAVNVFAGTDAVIDAAQGGTGSVILKTAGTQLLKVANNTKTVRFGTTESSYFTSNGMLNVNTCNSVTANQTLNIGFGSSDFVSALKFNSSDNTKIYMTYLDTGTNITHVAGWGLHFNVGASDQPNTGYYLWRTGGPSGFVERMRMINNGNLGLNTNNPLAKLHVVQDAAADAFRVDDSNADTTYFRIDSNGAVGIGTGATALSNALTVGGGTSLSGNLFMNQSTIDNVGYIYNDTASGVIISGTSNTADLDHRITVKTGTIDVNSASLSGVVNISGGSDVTIRANANGSQSNGLVTLANKDNSLVLNTSSVGIGTVTPVARLHVVNDQAADSLRIDDSNADTTYFRIDSNGAVGIGTGATALTAALTVSGDTALIGNLTAGDYTGDNAVLSSLTVRDTFTLGSTLIGEDIYADDAIFSTLIIAGTTNLKNTLIGKNVYGDAAIFSTINITGTIQLPSSIAAESVFADTIGTSTLSIIGATVGDSATFSTITLLSTILADDVIVSTLTLGESLTGKNVFGDAATFSTAAISSIVTNDLTVSSMTGPNITGSTILHGATIANNSVRVSTMIIGLAATSNTNELRFAGVAGDEIGYAVIAERLFNSNDRSELFLYKGNDSSAGFGPDRIRLKASAMEFQTFTDSEPTAAMYSNGTTAMYIASSATVGIGTTDPLAKLHIIQTGAADAFRIDDSAGDTSVFRVDSNGAVGVRVGDTVALSDALTVGGGGSFSNTVKAVNVVTYIGNNTFWPSFVAQDRPVGMYFYRGLENNGQIGLGFFSSEWDGSNAFGTLRMTVRAQSGNVGINTSTPTAKLHVVQDSSADAVRIDDELTDLTYFRVDSNGSVGVMTGGTVLSSALTVMGNTTLLGNLFTRDVAGDDAIFSTLTVRGTLALGSTIVAEDIYADDAIISTLIVAGTTNFKNTLIGKNMFGDIATFSTITVLSGIQLPSSIIADDIFANDGVFSTLVVRNTTLLQSTLTAEDIYADDAIVSTLKVAGTTALTGSLSGSDATFSSLTVKDSIIFQSTLITEDIYADDATVSTLKVASTTSLTGSLYGVGAAFSTLTIGSTIIAEDIYADDVIVSTLTVAGTSRFGGTINGADVIISTVTTSNATLSSITGGNIFVNATSALMIHANGTQLIKVDNTSKTITMGATERVQVTSNGTLNINTSNSATATQTVNIGYGSNDHTSAIKFNGHDGPRIYMSYYDNGTKISQIANWGHQVDAGNSAQTNTGFHSWRTAATGAFVERMHLDNAGNLGIGTSTQTAKLHIIQNDSNDAIRIDDSNGDTTYFKIDSNGRLGVNIGASTLIDTLNVRGPSRFVDDGMQTIRVVPYTDAGIIQSDNKVKISQTGATNDAFIVDVNNNRAGISQFNPSAKLHITNNDAVDSLRIDDSNGDTTYFKVDSNGAVGIGIGATEIINGDMLSIGGKINMNFNRIVNLGTPASAGDAATAGYVNTVTSNSVSTAVGLATFSTLTITGTSQFKSTLVAEDIYADDVIISTLTTNAFNASSIGIGTNTPVAKLEVVQDGAADAVRILDSNGDMSMFRIDSNGAVGIGTGSAALTYPLTVEGDALFTKATAANPQILLSGSYGIIDSLVALVAKNNSSNDRAFEIINVKDVGASNAAFKFLAGFNVQEPIFEMYGNKTSKLYGALDVNNSLITSVATPTASSDAANKSYVDNSVSTVVGSATFSTLIINGTSQFKSTLTAEDIYADDVITSTVTTVTAIATVLGVGIAAPAAKIHIVQDGAADAFRVDDSNGDTTFFSINSNGNVSINAGSSATASQVLNVGYGQFDSNSALKFNSGQNTKILWTFYDDGPKTSVLQDFGIETAAGRIAIPNFGFHTWQTMGAAAFVERMRLTNAGNLGIGTSNPTAKLEVVQDAGADALRVLDSNADTTYFKIDSNGSVGIGTGATALTNALTVVGAASMSQSVTIGTGTGDSNSQLIINTDDNPAKILLTKYGGTSGRIGYTTGNTMTFIAGNPIFTDSGTMTFTTLSSTTYVERMRLTPAGNLGIGTNGPAAKLHILQDLGSDAFRVDDQASDTTYFKIDSNGAIGIATGASALTNILTVAGTTLLQSTLTAEDIYADDIITSTITTNKTTTSSIGGVANTVNFTGSTIFNGDSVMSNALRVSTLIVGNSVSSNPNEIVFAGLNLDSGNKHTLLSERIYSNAGDDRSELLIYKGNDPQANVMDRIRLKAGAISMQVYSGAVGETDPYAERTTGLYIDSNANVGFGTETPGAKIHIYQNGASDCIRIDDAPNDTTVFRIDSNGNVGILQGTGASLTNALTVGGNSYLGGTVQTGNLTVGLSGTTTGANEIAFVGVNGDTTRHTLIAERLYVDGTERSELLLFKGDNPQDVIGPDRIRLKAGAIEIQTFAASEASSNAYVDRTTAVYVNSNANIGINTSTISAKLDIINTSNLDSMHITNNIDNISSMFRITSNGFVGIGVSTTQTLSDALTVAGTTILQGNLIGKNVSGDIATFSTITVTSGIQLPSSIIADDIYANDGFFSTLSVRHTTQLQSTLTAEDIYADDMIVSSLTVGGTTRLISTLTAEDIYADNIYVSSIKASTIIDGGNSAGTLGQTLINTSTGLTWINSIAGYKWTQIAIDSVTLTRSYIDVAYGNGVFIAIDSSSSYGGYQYAISTDGINWITTLSPGIINWSCITYGNGLWVVAASLSGGGKRFFTSSNGLTWIERSYGETTDRFAFSSIAYGNGAFIAVATGGVTSNTNARGVVSTDGGVTWSLLIPGVGDEIAFAKAWRSVTYGNGKFIVVGDAGAIMYSSNNGSTWAYTSASTVNWLRVAYGNGVFIAAGSNTFAYSADGITWTTVSHSGSWSSIAYGAGMWIAFNASDSSAISTDNGLSWTTNVINANVRSITYADGIWVGVGSNSLATYSGALQRIENTNAHLINGDFAITGIAQVSTLIIGNSTTSSMNVLMFAGLAGDGSNHTAIVERQYDGANECSELLLSKRGDVATSFGPDRIRMKAAAISMQVYSNSEGDLYAERTTALYIDSNANTGLGTVTPAAKLHIVQDSAADAFRVDDQASDTTYFKIDSNGSVGIGTGATTLTDILTVAGSARVSSLIIGMNNASVTPNTLYFSGTSNDTFPTTLISERIYDTGEKSELLLYKGDNAQTTWGPDRIRLKAGAITMQVYGNGETDFYAERSTALYINSNADIGIGTVAPAAKLHIVQDGAADAFRVDDSNGDTTYLRIDADGKVSVNAGASATANQVFNIGYGSGDSSSAMKFNSADNTKIYMTYLDTGTNITHSAGWGLDFNVGSAIASSGYITWKTGSASGYVEKMRLTTAGNLGIGTNNPTAKLEVVQDAGADALRVLDSNGDTTYFKVDSNGNVGVGMGSAALSYPFNVAGKALIIDNVAPNPELIFSGLVGGVDCLASIAAKNTNATDRSLQFYNAKNIGSSNAAFSFIGGDGTTNPAVQILGDKATRFYGAVGIGTGAAALTNTFTVYGTTLLQSTLTAEDIYADDVIVSSFINAGITNLGNSLIGKNMFGDAANFSTAIFSDTVTIRSTLTAEDIYADDVITSTVTTNAFSASSIGVGTATPVAKLEVIQSGAADAMRVLDTTGFTEYFKIDSNGNVGIKVGATALSNTFTVSGTTEFTDSISFTTSNKSITAPNGSLTTQVGDSNHQIVINSAFNSMILREHIGTLYMYAGTDAVIDGAQSGSGSVILKTGDTQLVKLVNSDKSLRFGSNEATIVTTTGLVGIGTGATALSNSLTVIGTTLLQSTLTAEDIYADDVITSTVTTNALTVSSIGTNTSPLNLVSPVVAQSAIRVSTLIIGMSDSNTLNEIQFAGVPGDGNGYTLISERLQADCNDYSELFIYKGNDIANATGVDKIRYKSGSHDFQIYTSNESIASRYSNGTTALYINSNALIGIGTSTPSKKLHILDNANANPAIRLEGVNGGINATCEIAAKNGGANDRSLQFYNLNNVGGTGPAFRFIGGDGSVNPIVELYPDKKSQFFGAIAAPPNVTIGSVANRNSTPMHVYDARSLVMCNVTSTTMFSTNMLVQGAGAYAKLTVKNTSGHGATAIDFDTYLGAYWQTNSWDGISRYRGTAEAAGRIEVISQIANNYERSDMLFHTCAETIGSGSGGYGALFERMRITTNGDVGINTSTPLAKLHVVQTAGADCFRIDDDGADVTYFKIDALGNVGVQSGLSTLTSAFTVAGNSQFFGNIAATNVNGRDAVFSTMTVSSFTVNTIISTFVANTYVSTLSIYSTTTDTLNVSSIFGIGATGTITMPTAVRVSTIIVGTNASSNANEILFAGTNGDSNFSNLSYHTGIIERIYGGTERSELLIFKGNDGGVTSGPDRIRMTAAAFSLQVYTNDTGTLSNPYEEHSTALYIMSNTNIGMGTEAPAAKLHIVQENAADALRVDDQIGDTAYFRIDSNGNVGVHTGATALTDGLTVNTSARVSSLTIGLATTGNANEINFAGVTGDGGLGFTLISERLYNGNDKSELLIYKGNDVTPSGPDRIRMKAAAISMQVYTSAAESDPYAERTTALYIDSNANIGIGTTTQTAKLEIVQTGATDCIRILDSNADTTYFKVDSNGYCSIIAGASATATKALNIGFGSNDSNGNSALKFNSADGDKILLTYFDTGSKIAQLPSWGFQMSAGIDTGAANNQGYFSWRTGRTAAFVEQLRLENNGQLNTMSNTIINVGTPTAATDAANKSYVDSLISYQSTLTTFYMSTVNYTLDSSFYNKTVPIRTTAAGLKINLPTPTVADVGKTIHIANLGYTGANSINVEGLALDNATGGTAIPSTILTSIAATGNTKFVVLQDQSVYGWFALT